MAKKTEWPKDFLWGAATSSHQVEGGTHNNWTVWELQTAVERAATAERRLDYLPNWSDIKQAAEDPENYVSGRASDHFRRYAEDFDIMHQLGFNAFRFSVEWSRIEPEEGKWDGAAVEHYRNYIRHLRARGIEPILTLYHWVTPVWFAEKGGFGKSKNNKYFIQFAEHLLRVLSDEIKYICTINEPDTVMMHGYVSGEHPPGEKSVLKGVWAYRNLLKSHKQIYKIAKRLNKDFMIGFVKSYAYVEPANDKLLSKVATRLDYLVRDDVTLAYIGRQVDFLGVNYYFTDRYDGFKRVEPSALHSDLGWVLCPENLFDVLARLGKTKLPLMVTETGVADSRDKYRREWIEQTVRAVGKSLDDGISVIGYLHWSLLDNFEWAYGKWPNFGLVEVDYGTQERTVRPSAKYYSEVIGRVRAGRV